MANNCTLFPEGTWSDCCAKHDTAYLTKGGSRWDADKELNKCVKKKCKVVAAVMWLGVRVAGWYWWKK